METVWGFGVGPLTLKLVWVEIFIWVFLKQQLLIYQVFNHIIQIMDITYFFFFGLAPVLILNYLMQKPLKEFTRLYRKKIDSSAAFSVDELKRKYKHKQVNFVKEVPKNIWLSSGFLWKDF